MRKRRLADESLFGDTNVMATLGLMLCVGAVAMVLVVVFVLQMLDVQHKKLERQYPSPKAHTTATPAP